VTAATSVKLNPRAARSLRTRQAFHRDLIASAPTWRMRADRIAGWITAEGVHLGDADRAEIEQKLTALAYEMHRRNGGEDDRPQ
jgi:hypothetical protein